MDSPPLPRASGNVEVHLLNGGSFMADTEKINAGCQNRRFRLYNWAFAIYHKESDRKLIWDLGLVNEPALYPPFIQNALFPDISPTSPRQSIPQQIQTFCKWNQGDVDTVIFSHAHFDHCRPCAGDFPSAKVYFGPGTGTYCRPDHFQDAQSQWDGRFFNPSKRTENWEELQGSWQQFGAFAHAIDLFGDGSFWVIQAPGHMGGNLCAAARLSSGEYVLLAGDCCHSRDILLGKCDFAVFNAGGRQMCLQDDVAAAHDTLKRIREMETNYGFHVLLAHDSTWLLDDRDPVLFGLVDQDMLESAKTAVARGEPF